MEPPDDFSIFNDVGTNLDYEAGWLSLICGLSCIRGNTRRYNHRNSAGRRILAATSKRDGRNEGWLRIGDETFAMKATEILGDARLPMLELWRPRARESARAIAQAAGSAPPTSRNSEPQLLPEIFLWTPR